MIGIYKITNKLNGKSYIGQSNNIKRRWREHRRNIGLNKNPMYLDFKKYGLNNFIFEIIEECSLSELNDKEIYWIKYYNTFNNGYNLTKGGQGNANPSNQKQCIIDKPQYEDNNSKFMYIGIEEIREAAKTLSPSALKLYLYFAENEAGWQFYLSPKDFYKTYGVAESTYRNAKVELIKKGYIMEEEGKNCFTFFTSPRSEVWDMNDLKRKLNLLGNKIKDENIESYNKYFEKVKTFKDLPDDEKYYKVEQLIKEMQRELDNIYKEKDVFDI